MTKTSLEYAKSHSKQWHDSLKKKVTSSPEALAAYERTKKEIELSMMLREAREKSDLSQDDLAARMHTSRTAISRLESSGMDARHSPSINTLLRYAHALGYTVDIKLVAKKYKRQASSK